MPGLLHLNNGERRQWLEDYAFTCLFLSMPHAALFLCKSRPPTLHAPIEAHSVFAGSSSIGLNFRKIV
jgi:hypothetical protein